VQFAGWANLDKEGLCPKNTTEHGKKDQNIKLTVNDRTVQSPIGPYHWKAPRRPLDDGQMSVVLLI
jgi:hypothetical protein